jgi:hypothetical protein
MYITQLSVFVENKPGRLQNVLKILSDEKINIVTLTIAEVNDFGILRLIVNDPERARQALKKNEVTCSTTDVLAIEIEDTPGSLYKAIETFSKRNLNIEYMYAFTKKHGTKAVMIFRFEDIDQAKKALLEEGYSIVKKTEIIGE